jgi:hypothetical protein
MDDKDLQIELMKTLVADGGRHNRAIHAQLRCQAVKIEQLSKRVLDLLSTIEQLNAQIVVLTECEAVDEHND